MNDPFFDSVRDDWQSHGADSEVVLHRLRRHRWTPHLILAFEIFGCVLTVLCGLWFAWMATRVDSNALLFGLSASVLLLVAPLLGIAIFVARRPSLRWDEATPEMLLETAMRRTHASLRVIRLGRIHTYVIAAFVLVLWLIEAMGLIQARSFLVLYSAVCIVACTAHVLWCRVSERRLIKEREICTRLLAELRGEA